MMKPVLRWVDEQEVLRLLDWEDLLLFNVKSIKRLPFIYKVVGDGLDDVNLRAQCGWLCVDELDVFMIRNWELLRRWRREASLKRSLNTPIRVR